MGVERAVTRWYALRQSLLDEIAALEAQLNAQAAGTGAAKRRQQRQLPELIFPDNWRRRKPDCAI